MNRLMVLLLLVVAAFGVHAGDKGKRNPHETIWTGNARVDLFGQRELFDHPQVSDSLNPMEPLPRKSPWIAAGLSIVLPGAGEFYAESYWKAALFFTVEVGAWFLAYKNDQRGDRQTENFQAYADGHWSVNQYANYSVKNAAAMNPAVIPANYGVFRSDQTVNWSELNRLERDIGGWYSHTLPPYGDQQYYELIGKYPQFYSGWNDADTNLAPVYQLVKENLSANYRWYSGERGKANDFYATATTFITIAVVNHVLSALDAAWSAGSHNGMHVSGEVMRVPTPGGVAYVPGLRVQKSF
jgi:hypothetical protein